VFSPTHTVGEQAAMTKEFMRRPDRYAKARAQHLDVNDILFGADPLAGDAVAGSVWWVQADGLDGLADVDQAELGAALRQRHSARTDAAVDVGRWMSMIQCAGRVSRDGDTRLQWGGNRIVATEDQAYV
jgi:hypothetical protein